MKPKLTRRLILLLSVFSAVFFSAVGLGACTALPTEERGGAGTGASTQALPSTRSIDVFFTGTDERAKTLEEALNRSIDAAGESIDLAMYNFNMDSVGSALIEAHRRGVRVRMVSDSDALDGRWFDRLRSAGIEVLGDGREELMHNKFVVIDGREVWTGSLNLTESGATQDDNNFVRFVSNEMGRRYKAVFEAMYEDGQFGRERGSAGENPEIDVVGVPVEVYFSPEDAPSGRLLALVRGAKKSVHFLAYSFTNDALADALVQRAGAGVEVRGVFDESQTDGQGADYAYLRQTGLDVRLDGNPNLMHNKVLVIDGETVVFGSYNFTRSAERNNDENVVIVHDEGIASLYEAEFERIYQNGE